MRFADGVDEVLRNYGDAYSVEFDMTDMEWKYGKYEQRVYG